MKNTTKKIMSFRFDRYEDIEIKLEKMAAKGLFLKECGSYLWTFKRGAPQKLKYTVTYFSEGSVFNPDITENQQTYFDYAAAAGWNFVTGFNQMQIFCSSVDNSIPFETDESEKLNNIKKCMKKSFIPSLIMLIVVFVFNLVVQYNSFAQNPIDFLSESSRLVPVIMLVVVVAHEVYTLFNYYIWCKNSEKSIANGGMCSKNSNRIHKTIDIIFTVVIFGSLAYLLLCLAFQMSWFGLLISLAQVPILIAIFGSSIKFWKKKKASAMKNRVISIVVLLIADVAYLAMLMAAVLKFGFNINNKTAYQTITWPVAGTYSHEYKIYSDEIPLTCEDLYGQIDYEYYSYESDFESTLFLTKNAYRQESLPAKDAPPQLEYEILESRFDFVYKLVKDDLLEVPEWRENISFKLIDNRIFDTIEAYQRFYENMPTGEYLMFYENKIIVLNADDPLNDEQILVVKKKLGI